MNVSHDTALGLDIGKNVTGHVTAQELKFGDKFFLRPIPLITELGNILSDDIGLVLHECLLHTTDSSLFDFSY
jgi:hypothetical protein